MSPEGSMTGVMSTRPPRPRHRRWIAMFILGSATFALMAMGVAWSEPMLHFDESVADTLHRHAAESPAVVAVMLWVTGLGTVRAFVVLAVVVVAGLWLAGRLRLGAAWLLALIGGGLWVDGL